MAITLILVHARHDGSCEGMRIMDLQDQICGGLMSSGTYETGIDGVPISDQRGNLPGIRNQGKAIQAFHNLYSQEAQTLGCKSIGTLSSFFEEASSSC